ncbi:MAG: thiol reductant ABC exporter subunit CydC [Betaproteobacteria bacterium]|nr:thiol reductant ABC exporter subunit CydC [Betaproteobacteria bacterium]
MKRTSTQPPSAARDLWRLIRLFRPYRAWMAAGGALALATVLANVGLMAVSGWFISAMALAGLAGTTMNYFTPAALIRLFAIVRTGGRYLERLVTHEATFRLLSELRVWFYTRLEPLAPARLQRYRSADMASRIQSDIDSLNHVYLRVIVPIAVAALGTLIILAVMAAFSPAVAATSAMFLGMAGIALPAYLRIRAAGPGEKLVQTRAALRGVAVDGIQGLAELRVYGAVERHSASLRQLSDDHIEAQGGLSKLTGFSQGALGLCANLALWVTMLLAIPRVYAGTLAAPDLALLALFVLASFEAVAPLPQAFQSLGESLSAVRRLFEIIDAEPAILAPPLPSPPLVEPRVSIQGLCFRYGDEGPWVLAGIDLELAAGKRLALVGPTGAGKSTLVQLLLRFWEYPAGKILLGGHDLRAFQPEDLRTHIAVVSQDAYLFNATVRENLLIARPDASDEQLVAACRTAQIHDFVASLPAGYDTELGEGGTRISGGQARRIAIARALLLDAPILILDEPTEGLDPPTARALLDAIHALMQGRSVLLITHRLDVLAALVDEVVVLEAGRIVEWGTVQALASSQGAYRRLQDDLAEG